MSRTVSAPISDFFQRAHLSWGTKLHFGFAITRIESLPGGRYLVVGNDGPAIEADAIVVGIGVVPNSELAAAAGLQVDNGIVVDSCLFTSDHSISAIGDCANFLSDYGRARLESVQNAADQARYVAGRLTGMCEQYSRVPWFWSEQNEFKLQIAGVTKGHTHTALRGNLEQGRFSVFCFDGDRLLGIESVNAPADHIIGRRLLATRATVMPQEAANTGLDLKTLLQEPDLKADVA
jgi:3-phenylpropionate/trans-cinnamate dioxygenase ferredoxin reductase subunit